MFEEHKIQDPASTMEDDGDDKDDSKRKTRNLSEKKRRDQFNLLVTELSTLISSNSRKMDKSTVLKSTISFLKNHNEVTVRSRAHDVQEDWKPAFLSNEEFTYLVLEALEGFVMVFSASGKIHYVSESITSLLGHNSVDIVNKSIFDLTFEEDRPNLYSLLQRNATAAAAEQMLISGKENEMTRFQIHLRRGKLDFREEASYDLVQFYGHFRSNQELVDEDRDMMGYRHDHESRIIFICIGRLHTPCLIRDVSLVDLSRNEFTSRHSLEWKFLFLDHRAPPIIGYLPFEVLGTSGYDYYHFDDLDKVVLCHEALMRKGELTSCYYRFLTKGQQWIWLQTRFYITYHQWNSKPEFVVCNHRVISYEDIRKTTKTERVEQDTNASDTEAELTNNMKGRPAEEQLPPISPSYMSEAASDAYANSYRPISQPASVKSASGGSTAGTINTAATTGASWPRAHTRYNGGSDTASQSGDSRSSQGNCKRESQKPTGNSLAPLHGIGAQYLNPSVYGVVPTGMVPLSTMPVLVTSDQAQIQLQRKHEELQQMIVRQQEELRQVKEQLLLARLGILQPLINVQNPYSTPEEMQNQQRLTQLAYTNAPHAVIANYPQHAPLPLPLPALLPQQPHPPQHSHPQQQPQQPLQPHPTHAQHPSHQPHPTHSSDQHQHMPQ